MTIKYVDITIIRIYQEENILKTFYKTLNRLFNIDDDIMNDNDTIIITFDDGMICDTKNEYINKNYKFSNKAVINVLFPIYFTFNNNTLFYKNPLEHEDGIYYQNFESIFNNCSKYEFIGSIFNVIYQDANKKEKFSIIRIQSTEDKPRFKLAYDDTLFDKSDIIYLVDCIFKDKFNYKI